MVESRRFADFALSAPPSGLTALAVSTGDGWLLEVRDDRDILDLLLVQGPDLNLLGAWSDTALRTLGVYRCGEWKSLVTAFGFIASVRTAH